jgi:hypothetical protein
MSSTNRSNARESHVADYYLTPIKDICTFLNAFGRPDSNIDILDPCGGGSIGQVTLTEGGTDHLVGVQPMAYPEAIKQTWGMGVISADIRDDSPSDLHGSYLDLPLKNEFDMIITNPPFNIALDIIKKALDDVREGGWVIMLLRLNFLGSKSRKLFWDNHMPHSVYVHHQRMSFTSDGGTDSIEYAHFCWRKDSTSKCNSSKLFVI